MLKRTIFSLLILVFPLSLFAQNLSLSEEVSEPKETTQPKKRDTKSIKIVYPRRGCLNATGSDSIGLLTPLFDHFAENSGNISIRSSGFAALTNQSEFFLSSKSATNASVLKKGLDSNMKWTEVEKIPILVNRREVLFQYPFRGHFNWLSFVEKFSGKGKEYKTTKTQEATIFKANFGGETFLKLKLKGKVGNARVRSALLISKIDAPDDTVNLYSIGLRMGRGSRVKPKVEALLSEGKRSSNLLLHFGHFANSNDAKLTDLCAGLLGHLNPMAGVPSFQELELGKEKLKSLEKKHHIPIVAANLVDPKTKKPIFRRFSILEVDGLTIAVFGIVGEDQLKRVSASKRGQWKTLDTRLALATAYEDLRQQLQKKPDFSIVLLSSSTGEDLPKVSRANIDLVLRSTGRTAFGETFTEMQFPKNEVEFRYPFIPEGTGIGVNEINIEFQNDKLNTITHRSIPIGDDAPIDVNVVEAFRKVEDLFVEKGARVVLPDIDSIVRSRPKLHPLVWGSEIPINGRIYNRTKTKPTQFTDPLWMRLVTNIMKKELRSDVAISQNLKRESTMIGPINGWLANRWLSNSDQVGTVTLSGSELLSLWSLLNKTPSSGARTWYFSGFQNETPKINGRKIVPSNPYRVALTKTLVTHPEFEPIFKKKNISWSFTIEDGQLKPNKSGELLDLKTLSYRTFDSWSDKKGNFDPSHLDAFEKALVEDGSELKTEYRLRLNSLGFTGSLFQNTSNIRDFADTRETRLSTPDNFSLGGKLDLDFLVDGKLLGWESGIKAELARIVFDIPGQDIAPQERADDILIFSEARINAAKVNVAEAGMPLIPFIRLEYDSEFTATSDPSDLPDGQFPHQRLVNILVGTVLFPGDVLRELRLAPIAQLDLSGDAFRTDFGVRLAYKLKWNIAPSVYFESNSSLSYLIPDSDDRSSDLALRLISKNNLVAPLWKNFSIFAFADLFYAVGKTSANDSFGGSSVVGAGIKYADIWRF